MNLAQINEFRAAQGLAPVVAKNGTNKRQQDANRAARAQACRDLKSKRNSNRK
jgi:hypothetical protein